MLACKVDYEIKDSDFGITTFTGHYMLPARIGQRLEIMDHRKAVKLLDICNRAGMCSLTTSGIVNWVTRLYEDGIIAKKVSGGMELQRDFESYVDLFNRIAGREDFGDILADGWYPTSKKIGMDPDYFVPGPGLVKGADSIRYGRFSTLDCERFANITNPRPHHGGLESRQSLAGLPLGMLKDDINNMGVSKDEFDRVFEPTPYYGRFNVARYAKHCEDVMAAFNSVGTCVSTALLPTAEASSLKLVASLYSAATGIGISTEELKKLGERAFNLFKLLNVREGFTRRDDVCPKVWLSPRDSPDGTKIMMDYYKKKTIILRVDIERLLNDYYNERSGAGIQRMGLPQKRGYLNWGLKDDEGEKHTGNGTFWLCH
ncbi:MAG: aldehyde ferredoxin oxidoreductase C-terminal domain-containing protein [Halobacteriota archaeon]|nr:aldehyde ferredoxin oxidoreductase C-terminal domain-containing protein [Halobacteriota archaeon]